MGAGARCGLKPRPRAEWHGGTGTNLSVPELARPSVQRVLGSRDACIASPDVQMLTTAEGQAEEVFPVSALTQPKITTVGTETGPHICDLYLAEELTTEVAFTVQPNRALRQGSADKPPVVIGRKAWRGKSIPDGAPSSALHRRSCDLKHSRPIRGTKTRQARPKRYWPRSSLENAEEPRKLRVHRHSS